ncbi:glycosyltransferase family 8 protein [Tabrizicola sp.]|uniref:glycosyltransferase family 8 protein n=1 Tax=Tabrizicola sp. TaxID=2005166 RepID=UPI0026013806|nr:glycosyltransferase family 8 protein [Tabrizicola sp.]
MEPSTAPKSALRKAVVLCVDQQFLPYALFLANQLHQNEVDRDYDICLISDTRLKIPDEFERLRLILPEPVENQEYDKLHVSHLAKSTYLRMWAPRLLAKDYDRLIYLDSDMFIDVGGLSKLFEVDMRGKPLAAVLDVQQWYNPRRVVEEFSASNQGFKKYFNAGFLLIDISNYLSNQVLERALQIGSDSEKLIIHHDQSLLNLCLAGDWTELSPVWNWQLPSKYPLFTDWSGARILHFFGGVKPWNDPMRLCPERIRLAYELFLRQHFPEVIAIGAMGTNVLHSPRRMAWMALRFLALRPRILRYLSRFPNPYETK